MRIHAIFSIIIIAPLLILPSFLTPDPSGQGTHTQLGLPSCPIWSIFSIPCPGCGLTTSFTHITKGQLATAWQTQPMGIIFYALGVIVLGLSLISFFKKEDWFFKIFNLKRVRTLTAAIIIIWSLNWIITLTQ